MNKNYLFIGVMSASVLALSFSNSSLGEISAFSKSHRNAAGAPMGNTGAPGESTCANCHSGNQLQDGSTENILIISEGGNPVTEYLPGNTYTVSLGMASNPSKKGFQATALDGTNTMAGNFTSMAGVNVNGTSRKFANHTSLSNTSSTIVWQWQWTAPATNVGNVTFYVSTNKANNNGAFTGDFIYLSQHVIAPAANAGTEELVINKNDLKVSFNSLENNLQLNFNSLNTGKVYIRLLDAAGKSVFSAELGEGMIGENKFSVRLPEGIKNGIYFAHVFVHNTPMSAKVMIQK